MLRAMSDRRVFLTAEWRHLAMLSYAIDPDVLMPFLPRPLELDFWHGKTYLTVVGFVFRRARLFGIRIPFYQSFPELNLRFYVVRHDEFGERRGVIFLREFAPKWCVGVVARQIYNESYLTLPMRYSIEIGAAAGQRSRFQYDWRFDGQWNRLHVETSGSPWPARAGSLDEFIVDHYWAYTRQREGGCAEYQVDHPPWPIRRAVQIEFDCDPRRLYGDRLGRALRGRPESAFVAEGSAVAVHRGVIMQPANSSEEKQKCATFAPAHF
jgi:uncharacterized protein YqjF (DUF2071 family)